MTGLQFILRIEGVAASHLAEKLEISRAMVSQWLHGVKPISVERIAEIAALFPYYPPEYFDKQLTEEDQKYLKKLKTQNKHKKDERFNAYDNMLNKLKEKQNNILKEINMILNFSKLTKLVDISKQFNDVSILSLLYATAANEQEQLMHDYGILNKLEAMKLIKKEDDISFDVVSVALSALAETFGFDDDLKDFVASESMKTVLPSEALENLPHIQRYNERKAKIKAILKEMVEEDIAQMERTKKMNEELAQRRGGIFNI